MKIIGLTGPSGAGKGMVSSFFEYHNIKSVDADAVYRKVVTPPSSCLDELASNFGCEIIKPDKTLDRKKLAEIVFSDQTKKKQELLNSITHKYVLKLSKKLLLELEEAGNKAAIFDAPLLFESGFDSECDLVISVLADRQTRIERIVERDGISKEAAIARIDSQMPDEFYASRSDFIIHNDSTKESLKLKVEEIMKKLEVLSD